MTSQPGFGIACQTVGCTLAACTRHNLARLCMQACRGAKSRRCSRMLARCAELVAGREAILLTIHGSDQILPISCCTAPVAGCKPLRRTWFALSWLPPPLLLQWMGMASLLCESAGWWPLAMLYSNLSQVGRGSAWQGDLAHAHVRCASAQLCVWLMSAAQRQPDGSPRGFCVMQPSLHLKPSPNRCLLPSPADGCGGGAPGPAPAHAHSRHGCRQGPGPVQGRPARCTCASFWGQQACVQVKFRQAARWKGAELMWQQHATLPQPSGDACAIMLIPYLPRPCSTIAGSSHRR